MDHAQLIHYGPLILATFEVISTFLFFGYGSRADISPIRFWWTHMLWYAFSLASGMLFVCFSASLLFRSDEAVSRLLILIFLGLVGPIYSAFGLAAWTLPTRWGRFVAQRNAAQRYFRSLRILTNRSKT